MDAETRTVTAQDIPREKSLSTYRDAVLVSFAGLLNESTGVAVPCVRYLFRVNALLRFLTVFLILHVRWMNVLLCHQKRSANHGNLSRVLFPWGISLADHGNTTPTAGTLSSRVYIKAPGSTAVPSLPGFYKASPQIRKTTPQLPRMLFPKVKEVPRGDTPDGPIDRDRHYWNGFLISPGSRSNPRVIMFNCQDCALFRSRRNPRGASKKCPCRVRSY
jgi:hypothetical protein